MTIGIDSFILLAAEAGGDAAATGTPAPQVSGWQAFMSFAPFLLILVGFFWFTSRSQKKRDRERQSMLDAIRPKDDVMTIGGMCGRVVSINDDEVVLRVDQDKDVKITFSRTAISRKIGDETPDNK